MLHLPPPSPLLILWTTFISSLAQDDTLFMKNLKFCSPPRRLLSKVGFSKEVFMAVAGIIRTLLWKDKVSTMESGRSESKGKTLQKGNNKALLLSETQCRASKRIHISMSSAPLNFTKMYQFFKKVLDASRIFVTKNFFD